MLRASNTAGLCFRPGPIYTFHFYQHLLDISNFRLHMPVSTPDDTRRPWCLASDWQGDNLKQLCLCSGDDLQFAGCVEWPASPVDGLADE